MIKCGSDLNSLNVLVVGTGVYACGRGTDGYGTIVPALLEMKKDRGLGTLYIAGTDPKSLVSAKKKIDELKRRMGVDAAVKYFPDGSRMDNRAYLKALREIPRPACCIVAVPDNMHREIAGAAVKEKLHTLVVKPLAPSVREVRELLSIQEKSGVYCAVEFHKRLDLANLKLKDTIDSGAIGDPLYFIVEYSQRKIVPTGYFRKWVHATNVFQYLGIHYVDIIQFVTGARPVRVMGTGQKNLLKSQGIDTYDSIQAVIEWKASSGKNFSSHIHTNWIDPENTSAMSDQKIKVIGTKGRYESDQKRRGIVITTEGGSIEEPNPYFCSSYGKVGSISYDGYGIDSIKQFLLDAYEVENGEKSLEELESVRPTFKRSLIPTAALEAVNKSLQQGGKWIKVKGSI